MRATSTLHARTNVDEALFGDTIAEKIRKGKLSSTTAVVNKDILALAGNRSMARTTSARSVPPSAKSTTSAPVVISASHLDGIKREVLIRTEEDVRKEKEGVLAEKLSKQAAAQARKEKIRALEAERLAHVPKSQLEIEEEEEKERRRAMAQKMREAAVDDAKLMKMMQNYAITVSIRDRQLAEKRERKEAEAIEEKIKDAETELARLEEVKRVYEREQSQRSAARVAARDVYRQLEEREAAQRRRIELLKAEGEESVRKMKEADEKAKQKLEEERRKKAQMRTEVLHANEEALRIKAARKAADIAEDRRIEAIQLEMIAKKEAEEAEKERQHKLREEALFKVRGQVEKASDERAMIDELRAKRAFEAGQRVARQRELERARKQAAMIEDLQRARVEQLAAKQARIAGEIEGDKVEFYRALEVQQAWIAAEKEAQKERAEANRRHVLDLLEQKKQKEERAAAERAKTFVEGDVERAVEDEKAELLRKIREERVTELLSMGVDPKYTVQLAKYDPKHAVKVDYKLGAKSLGKSATSPKK